MEMDGISPEIHLHIYIIKEKNLILEKKFVEHSNLRYGERRGFGYYVKEVQGRQSFKPDATNSSSEIGTETHLLDSAIW